MDLASGACWRLFLDSMRRDISMDSKHYALFEAGCESTMRRDTSIVCLVDPSGLLELSKLTA